MPVREWITTEEFAELGAISPQAARKAVRLTLTSQAFIWRGATLVVRQVPSIGGKSGRAYQIQVASLPVSLQLALKDAQGIFEGPLRHDDDASRWREFWCFHLAPIAQHKPHSKDRGRAIAEAAAQEYIGPDGARCRFSYKTIHRKLKTYEADGFSGLTLKKRTDAGKRRVIVIREFDKAARILGVDDAQLQLISEKLRTYIRSLIAADVTAKKLKFLAEGKINALAASLGIATDGNTFAVPDHLINAERIFKAAPRFRRDRKAHNDAAPGITRTIAGLRPMDCVMGDVHPVDIVMTRADGSTATGRLIGWLDVATHRIFASLVLCEAGTGIRNAHVVQSFIDMVQAWGLPKTLYLDNGTEYNWADCVSDMLKLASNGFAIDVRYRFRGDSSRLGRVIKAQPYNAQAKGLIEGGFRSLETLFRDIEGYIGGNRMLKKSANVGRPPVSFSGSLDELQVILASNLRFYNGSPQRGQLRGRSPDQAFAGLVEAGWTATAVPESVLRLAFTQEKQRTVTKGCITYAGKKWTCDELAAYPGRTVTALIPKYERWDGIPLRDEHGSSLGISREETQYGYFDVEGARESARRKKLFRDGVKSLERQTVKIDVHQELENNIVRLPAPVRAPIGTHIGGTETAAQIIAGLEETPDEARIRKVRETAAKQDRQYERMIAAMQRQQRNAK